MCLCSGDCILCCCVKADQPGCVYRCSYVTMNSETWYWLGFEVDQPCCDYKFSYATMNSETWYRLGFEVDQPCSDYKFSYEIMNSETWHWCQPCCDYKFNYATMNSETWHWLGFDGLHLSLFRSSSRHMSNSIARSEFGVDRVSYVIC